MIYAKTETAILYHYLQDEIIDTTLVTPSLNYAMNRSYNKVVLVEELNKGIVRRIEQYGDEWITTELNAESETQEDIYNENNNPLSIGNRIE